MAVAALNVPKYGYNPSKPGTFYILEFNEYIKYGITNDYERRLKEHMKNNGEYKIILSQSYQDGQIAKGLEQRIREVIGGRFMPKEKCPDGYTETLCLSKINELMNTIHQYNNN